jgi:hypothetical protein
MITFTSLKNPPMKNINRRLFTLFLIVSFTVSFSQNFIWVKQLGGKQGDGSEGLTLDNSGNVYSTGNFRDTIDLDPGPLVYSVVSTGTVINGYVSKLDMNGNFVWGKKIASTKLTYGQRIQTDNAGNVYVWGFFEGTADFDPGPASYTLSASTTVSDVFLLKLDPSGNFLWVKQFGGPNAEWCTSLKIDASGNIYCAGSFYNCTGDFDPGPGSSTLTAVGTDMFIVKLNASGNFVWAKRIGGSGDDELQGLDVDASGNVYYTGYFQSTADFNPGASVNNLVSAGGEDGFVAKLDVNGNYVFAKRIGGTGNDYTNSANLSSSGNLIIGGGFASTCNFDPGVSNYTLTATGSYDGMIASFNTSGNFQWIKPVGDFVLHLDLDAFDNIYVQGNFNTTMDADPGPSVVSFTSVGSSDLFIGKYNPTGNFMWAGQIGGSSYEDGWEICADNSGSVYSLYIFSTTVDFDPNSGVVNLTSFGFQDAAILKLNAGPTTILENNMSPDDWSIFPNPSNGRVFINKGNEIKSVKIYNPNGSLAAELNPENGVKEINLDNLPSGIYFLEMKNDKVTLTRKLIKE